MIRDRLRGCKEKTHKTADFPRFFCIVPEPRGPDALKHLYQKLFYTARAILQAAAANNRRMSELQEQLQILRARMARIDSKYRSLSPGPSPDPRSPGDAELPGRTAQRYIEEWLTGAEIETSFGRHFETEKLYERHRRHGSADIGDMQDLPHDLLDAVSGGTVPAASPTEWAFLDTETTGLAGGTGTCAFLVGVGRITAEGFRVRQFFMRDYAEEASLLDSLTRHLAEFRVLITYNGRTFDQPLLETRYRMNRARPPFGRMEHLDLLHGARRLWKLRFESCRLVDLEQQILGVDRDGDVPGALIPYLYFEYLRTRRAARLLPVFQHNATDILTLACLTAIVPQAFRDPQQSCPESPLRHGAELVGLGRWLLQAGELERARTLFRRAVDAGLSDDLLFRTLWDVAAIERKLDQDETALAVWSDLASGRNPYRFRALEQIAKHWEHRAKDPAKALETVREALALAGASPGVSIGEARPAELSKEDAAAWRRREARLMSRVRNRTAGKRTLRGPSRSTSRSASQNKPRLL